MMAKVGTTLPSFTLASLSGGEVSLDACFAALTWLARSSGDLGVDPERIAISGQSAGGGLVSNSSRCLIAIDPSMRISRPMTAPMIGSVAAETSGSRRKSCVVKMTPRSSVG